DMQLYDGKYDRLWYPLENETFNFTEAQINFKAEIANYGEIGEKMYNDHRSQLELDTINLLYVTLTRAVEKLYVFAEMPTDFKENASTYNHLFMEFLKHKNMWNGEQMVCEFGKDSEKISKEKETISQTEPKYFSSNPKSHGLKIVASEEIYLEEETVAARIAGNMLHEIMAQIYSENDLEKVLDGLKERATIPVEEFENLKNTVYQIVNNPNLKHLFSGNDLVYSERDIITKEGLVLRPDRININSKKEALLIDYKTGSPKLWHADQLLDYANALMDMGFTVSEKILIYSNEDGIVINKV